MAHEIRKHDKVLSVRQPMWHGLEDLLSEAPSREEAEKLVHNFSVIREDIYRQVAYFDEVEMQYKTRYELIPEEQINVRSDTDMVLSSVPRTRVDIQPQELWDIAEEIMQQDSNIVIETAGSLRDGRDIWILLKLDEELTIKGDPHGNSFAYNALQNSYVPGKAARFQPTNVRVQCANTSSMADMAADQQGVNVSLAHTLNLRERIEEIRDFLSTWRIGIDVWRDAKEFMASVPVRTDQVNWFIEQYINAPTEQLTSDRVKDNIEIARMELLTEYFADYNNGVRGTALGLFEAASSWTGHVRAAQTPLTRFKRAMLTPDTILADARELALDAANV